MTESILKKARSTGVAEQTVMLHSTETSRTHTAGDTGPLNTTVVLCNEPPEPGPDVGTFYTDSLILASAFRRKAASILFVWRKILKCHIARTPQSCPNCVLTTLLPAFHPLGSKDPESLLSVRH